VRPDGHPARRRHTIRASESASHSRTPKRSRFSRVRRLERSRRSSLSSFRRRLSPPGHARRGQAALRNVTGGRNRNPHRVWGRYPRDGIVSLRLLWRRDSVRVDRPRRRGREQRRRGANPARVGSHHHRRRPVPTPSPGWLLNPGAVLLYRRTLRRLGVRAHRGAGLSDRLRPERAHLSHVLRESLERASRTTGLVRHGKGRGLARAGRAPPSRHAMLRILPRRARP